MDKLVCRDEISESKGALSEYTALRKDAYLGTQ